MSTQAHSFKVGLFVIGAVAIGTALLIWLGVSEFLSETRKYVTYFDESVQGLEIGSPVKFMGVVIGNVSLIKVAPDGNLVEVQMNLDDAGFFQKTRDMRAHLDMAGITGMKYVEVTRSPESIPIQIDFAPSSDYIPAKASPFQDVMTAIKEVYDKIVSVDFQGISDEAKETLNAVTYRATDPNLDSFVDDMAKSAKRVRRILEKKEVEDVIVEAAAVVTELKLLIHETREEVEGSNVKEAVAQLEQTIYNIDQVIERVDAELGAIMLNLRRATVSLARVVEKMDSAETSQVLFGEPPPERLIIENPTMDKLPQESFREDKPEEAQ